ncbi:MAG: hypothetical protein GY703_12535 [Gammaproteobacteria bacterium]|nr:hypothetical protein [Gammaproteobacteria bacterium]
MTEEKKPTTPSACRGGAPAKGSVKLCEVVEFHMYLDADRDGTFDPDRKGLDKWEWGKGKKGAIVLCNNDDDDSTSALDNADDKVAGGNDKHELAPLVIKKYGTKKPPASMKVTLEVDDADKIRIFESRSSGAKEIIGPTKGKEYKFPDLSFTEKKLGMEATQYANKSFNGLTKITLSVKGGDKDYAEVGIVRVAPWLMPNHMDKSEKVYVMTTGDNAAFVTDLKAQVGSANLVKIPGGGYANDRWMQDVMEIGFSGLPCTKAKSKWFFPVALRTANERDSGGYQSGPIAKKELLGPDYGFLKAGPLNAGMNNSQDSFGNLECSPPVKVGSKDYALGRIVYGKGVDDMDKKVVEMMKAQKLQAPIEIDTSWLSVGHVDEYLSFLPMKNAPKGFKVLLAGPKLAWDILKKLKTDGHGAAKLFQGIRYGPGYTITKMRTKYPKRTVGTILGDAALKDAQQKTQAKIDAQKSKLKTELELADTDFIDLPVLFHDLGGGSYIAYTPGVVNMLVFTKAKDSVKCCIPKPFGPMVGSPAKCRFEEDINSKIGPTATTGVEWAFIDDFIYYHVLMGEIHCGTNTYRKPPTKPYWWEMTI